MTLDIKSLTEQDKAFLKALKAKGKTMDQAFALLEKVKSSEQTQASSVETPGKAASNTLLESGMIGDLKEKADPTYEKPSMFGALEGQGAKAVLAGPLLTGGIENIKTGIEATGIPDILRGAKETISQGVSELGTATSEAKQKAMAEQSGQSLQPQETTAGLVSGVNDIIGGGLSAVFSPLTAVIEKTPVVNTLFEKISEGVDATSGFLADKLGTTDAEKEAIKKSFNNLFALGTIKYGPKVTEKVTGKLSSLGSKASDVAKNISSEVSQKATGLSADTMKAIIENPEKFKTVSDLGQEAGRTSLFDRVKSSMDDRISQLSETGKEYSKIRESSSTVKIENDFWDSFLKEKKITKGEDGKLVATSESNLRQPKDLSALQDIYDLYGKKTEYTANEYLNLRKDLDAMAKWAEGKTNASTAVAKEIRSKVDPKAKEQIPELAKADAEYAPEIEYLNSIKNLIYDKSGNVKDNAISTLANLTGKGKEFKLDRLEKLIPDIASDVKALKALQNVELAEGSMVGQYGRNIAAGAALMQGNLPIAALLVLTNPKIVSRLLILYGEKVGASAKVIDSITSKIEKGTEVSASEGALITKLINALSTEEASVVMADIAANANS